MSEPSCGHRESPNYPGECIFHCGGSERMPLCPVHESLDKKGKLTLNIYSHNCLACALHQREELLKMLEPFLIREGEDALSVLERVITVNDRNYKANYERGFRDGFACTCGDEGRLRNKDCGVHNKVI